MLALAIVLAQSGGGVPAVRVLALLIAALIVVAIAKAVFFPSGRRACPRCGAAVRRTRTSCQECGFDFGTLRG